LSHDFGSDAFSPDIHLKSGNALLSPSNFEIHISQVILHPNNIGEDFETISGL